MEIVFVKAAVKRKVEEFKKNAMLQEVSKYFEKIGFNNATIQDIAQHLGISVGSLYKLFSSKEELYSAYISYQRELFYARLEEKCNGKDPMASLKIFVQHKFEAFTTKRMAYLDTILKDPFFLVKLNLSNTNPLLSSSKILEKWFAAICQQEDFKEKDSLKLAFIFNAMINGYVEYWLNGGSLPENIDEIINNFFQGYIKV